MVGKRSSKRSRPVASSQSGEVIAVPIEKNSQSEILHLIKTDVGLSATINLPLEINSFEIGMLCLDLSRVLNLSDYEIEVLQTLAGQIGVALQNARRYESEQRQSTQHFLISEVGRQMASCASSMRATMC